MVVAALGVAVAVSVVAVVAAGSVRDVADRNPSEGVTGRAAFLLVPSGRSHAEVADLLGQPRMVRAAPGAEPGTDCWLYGSRSGRPIEYQLCFRRGFLVSKDVVPVRR